MDKISHALFANLQPLRLRETHCVQLFSIIMAKCAGREPIFIRDDNLDIKIQHYTSKGVTGVFTDPQDGQVYQITIEPESVQP